MRFGQLLGRVRPPRVQITYDVETAGALEKKELPFILGIISPLSGKSLKAPTPMAEKSWIFIDRENFNQVLESIAPRIAFSVPNTLANDSGELSVSVSFYNIDDFDPVAVIKHVPPLNCLFQGRRRLRDFMAKLDGNPALNSLVLSILVDKARRDGLKTIITEVQAKLDITPELTGLDARDKAILEAFRAKLAKDERSDINALLADGQIIEAEAQNSYRLELAEFISLLLQEDCKWVSIFEELDALAALLKTQKAEECVAISTLETKAALLKARQAIKDTEKKQEILIGHINISNEISRYIDKRDTIISRQLNLIIHHPEFQAMEASWRGLNYLVMNTETNANLKLSVLDATFDELYTDLDSRERFEHSALFELINQEESASGNAPFSALIGDFQFGRTHKDIYLLKQISEVTAAAHLPFIASAYAKRFDELNYASLSKPIALGEVFDNDERSLWRAFNEIEDSRYITLTLPKVMIRLPYHHENNPVEDINFDEDVTISDDLKNIEASKPVDLQKLLCANPAYLLGQRITNAFSLYGWTAAICGVEGGGLIEGLPDYAFDTQISITDCNDAELNELGFMPICHYEDSNKAAFVSGETTNNSHNAPNLPYLMVASRFAHYIKVIMQQKIGSFISQHDIENYLNSWISDYVLLDDSTPSDIQAQFPLKEARITVTDIPGKPSAYRATLFIKPHFQLQTLTTPIRLVVELSLSLCQDKSTY